MEYTREQIVDKLNNDIDFAVDFALWNNGQAIIDKWATVVGTPNPSYADLKNYIVQGLQTRNQKVADLLSVAYIPNINNWTAGFGDYFNGNLNYMDPGNGYKSAWSGLLQGVGAFFTAWGGSMNSSSSTGQPQLTPQQQAALDEQKRKEEEEKRKQTITLVAIIGGSLILITTAIILTVTLGGKSKPKTKPAA